jgi:Tat protein translocase TatB subunit
MFGIGTSEILIILLLALLVLGPKEIPKIARTLGRGLREIERAKDELKQSIEFEVEDTQEKDSKDNAQSEFKARKDDPEPSEKIDEEMSNLPSNRV